MKQRARRGSVSDLLGITFNYARCLPPSFVIIIRNTTSKLTFYVPSYTGANYGNIAVDMLIRSSLPTHVARRLLPIYLETRRHQLGLRMMKSGGVESKRKTPSRPGISTTDKTLKSFNWCYNVCKKKTNVWNKHPHLCGSEYTHH